MPKTIRFSSLNPPISSLSNPNAEPQGKSKHRISKQDSSKSFSIFISKVSPLQEFHYFQVPTQIPSYGYKSLMKILILGHRVFKKLIQVSQQKFSWLFSYDFKSSNQVPFSNFFKNFVLLCKTINSVGLVRPHAFRLNSVNNSYA